MPNTDSQYEDIKQNAGIKAANVWLKAEQESDLYDALISKEYNDGK